MLLNLLKRLEVSKISIAGFDGFETSKESNYTDASFQNDRHIAEFDSLNSEIEGMLGELVSTLQGKTTIKLITPSRFQEAIDKSV